MNFGFVDVAIHFNIINLSPRIRKKEVKTNIYKNMRDYNLLHKLTHNKNLTLRR